MHVEGLFPCLLWLAGLAGTVKDLPLLVRAFRDREHPDAPLLLARGARWFIAALACACIALGEMLDSRAFFWFGVAFPSTPQEAAALAPLQDNNVAPFARSREKTRWRR